MWHHLILFSLLAPARSFDGFILPSPEEFVFLTEDVFVSKAAIPLSMAEHMCHSQNGELADLDGLREAKV